MRSAPGARVESRAAARPPSPGHGVRPLRDQGLDAISGLIFISLVFLLLPLALWIVLRGRHPRANLTAWCWGAALYGVGYLLIGLRGALPDWLSIHLANVATLSSLALRWSSLRLEAGRPPAWGAGALVVALALAVFWSVHLGAESWRVAVGLWLQALGHLALAAPAWLLWRGAGLRLAGFIVAALAAQAVYMFLLVLMLQGGGWQAVAAVPSWQVLVNVGVIYLLSMVVNLAYLGMIVERGHRLALQRAQVLVQETAQRQAAEAQALQLKSLLDEREDLLQLLAHEVRQPLNNANAALQGAQQALLPLHVDAGAVRQRLQRASQVLAQVTGAVDNTLTATALLASPERVERRDVDVDTLLALALGDVPAGDRARVQVLRATSTRTALMDGGLLRLALRNLLCNALAYTPAASPVVLRVLDSDEPLALVLEVQDCGPGIDPKLSSRLFERGVRGKSGLPGHGLGLHVVKRVMDLHGGRVELRGGSEGGCVFSLWLPQDLPDRRRVRRDPGSATVPGTLA